MAKNMYQKREERRLKKLNENNGEEKLTKVGINWYPGHMVKTKRQILEDINLIDVVVEILDARIPVSSQNPDVADIIKNKKRIIALNKCDLANEKESNNWVNYFKKQGITSLLTDSNSGKGIANVIKEIEKINAEDLKKYAAKGRIGKSSRVLILGIPNVGKSSFINRIAKKTSAEVGNKPGVTKRKQWVRVNNKIELLDTPGVLWPKLEGDNIGLNLAFTGTIKDDILEKTEIAYYLVKYLYENNKEQLANRYKLSKEELDNLDKETVIADLIELIARKRGAIRVGNIIDDEKISGIILDDFRTCKIGKITLEKV